LTVCCFKIERRVSRSIDEKLKQVQYIGIGVTPQAQRLFHHIAKTINEVKWDGDSIIVLDTVRITRPYKVSIKIYCTVLKIYFC
jgi:hypothetical protein